MKQLDVYQYTQGIATSILSIRESARCLLSDAQQLLRAQHAATFYSAQATCAILGSIVCFCCMFATAWATAARATQDACMHRHPLAWMSTVTTFLLPVKAGSKTFGWIPTWIMQKVPGDIKYAQCMAHAIGELHIAFTHMTQSATQLLRRHWMIRFLVQNINMLHGCAIMFTEGMLAWCSV